MDDTQHANTTPGMRPHRIRLTSRNAPPRAIGSATAPRPSRILHIVKNSPPFRAHHQTSSTQFAAAKISDSWTRTAIAPADLHRLHLHRLHLALPCRLSSPLIRPALMLPSHIFIMPRPPTNRYVKRLPGCLRLPVPCRRALCYATSTRSPRGISKQNETNISGLDKGRAPIVQVVLQIAVADAKLELLQKGLVLPMVRGRRRGSQSRMRLSERFWLRIDRCAQRCSLSRT
jgi:hypothetical protein